METETTEKKQQKPVLCPFVVLIDSAEQMAFHFTGLKCDADKQYRPLTVLTERRCLGRHPDSLGDYSLTSPTICGVGRCHVERKALSDAHSTILGFGDGHRQRFESELSNLNAIDAALVIVEASFSDFLRLAPEYGRKTRLQNTKTLNRSVLSFQQDFPRVQWMFADGPRLAEQYTFRWLERWYRKQVEAAKAIEKELAAI